MRQIALVRGFWQQPTVLVLWLLFNGAGAKLGYADWAACATAGVMTLHLASQGAANAADTRAGELTRVQAPGERTPVSPFQEEHVSDAQYGVGSRG
jgi:hypothetical protein